MPEREAGRNQSLDARPRLLVLSSTYPRWPGDTEPRFVHELCRRLSGDFRVRVISPHAPGARRDEVMDGVEIHRFRYAPTSLQTLASDGGIMANLRHARWKFLLIPGFLLALTLATWRNVNSWGPNVVHAHWLIPQGLAIALVSLFVRPRPAILVTCHGTDLNGLRFWPVSAIKRFAVSRANAVTVVSKALLTTLMMERMPAHKTKVIPMGVDLSERFTPNDSVPRPNNVLLYVGRLVEVKGLSYLIAAMPTITKSHPDVRLSIVGSGPDAAALHDEVAAHNLEENVEFLGAIPQHQLPELYRRATIFVAPSIETKAGHQEGLGLVAIEAIGCGCPALVSDLPGTRDVVPQKTCRVTPGSPSELSTAILKILAMPPITRKKLASRQRKFIKGRFDWRFSAESYCQMIKSCMSGK